MLKNETVNPEHVSGKKLNPSKATETSLDSTSRDDRAVASEAHGEKTMAAKCIHKLHRCAQESKKIGEGEDDRELEEVHLKVPHSKVRRNARQLRVLGSFIATHGNAEKDSSG